VTETRVSRREFLKLLGSGAAALGLGVIGFNTFFNNNPKIQYNNDNNGLRASAQSAGSWDSPVNQPLQTTTVHATLIEGGKVLWIMGSGNNEPAADGPYYHGIWNPDGSFGSTNTLSDDLFCCGMATLANGNVLLCGGTLDHDNQALNGKWHGGKYAYEADFSSGSIGNRTEMAAGRWYPTCVTLPDGKVFVVQGWDEYGCNNRLVEIYDPGPKSWQIKLDSGTSVTYCVGSCATQYYPEAGSPCYGPGCAPYLSLYPRMHLMPSGLIASVGAELDDRVYDPNTFKWVWSGKTIKRHYGTSVLCPLENTATEKGKILVCGGSPLSQDPATNTAQIVEPSGTNGLSRRSVQSMQYARKHIGPVILPTGQIVIFGGNLQTNKSPVLNPEMFDPVSETWTVWPAATVPRMYHQVSLLLHDGRVWTAGTTPTQLIKEVRVEIFNPWYISETRPTISGEPTGGAYGDTITIPTPNAADITKVSLVKVSATTHHYNTDQRLIWLQIESKTASSVTVKAPINNKLAPPGYYLIHVLNSAGIPSVGTFIKIPGSGDSPPPPPPGTYTSIYSVAGSSNYGKLYTGSLKRAGEYMQKSSTLNSILIGQSVKRVNVILKKSGNPTGTISVVVRKASGDSIGHTFGTIDASTLTTTDKTLTLEASSSYTIAANDRILVEWNGTGSTTDQVWVKKSVSDTSTGGFDGQNTKWTQYITGYSNQHGYDLAGEWFKLV
jgi:hypothetical protein